MSAIFYQIFIFDQMIALQKLWKMFFLFHLKSSFFFPDIQIFVLPFSPLFLPVSHCFRGWSKLNRKVYDVIMCLNKNLITRFALCLEKKKWYDIEALSIDRVLNKKHFNGQIIQKMCTKSYFQTLLKFLLNNPKQPLHARNSFNNRHFERGLSKSLKKVNFICSFETSPF